MLPEVLRTAKDLAVVAAGQRTSVLHSRTGRPAVQPRSWGQPVGRSGALACWAQRSSRRSRHDDRVTLDVEVGVRACRRLHFDESRRAEGAQPSHIEPQPLPDLEQILRVVCRDATVPLLDACRSQRSSERSASCSSAAARALPRLPWPRGPSSRTSAAGSAIAIALFAAAARHACGMRLRGSKGAGLACSHASRC